MQAVFRRQCSGEGEVVLVAFYGAEDRVVCHRMVCLAYQWNLQAGVLDGGKAAPCLLEPVRRSPVPQADPDIQCIHYIRHTRRAVAGGSDGYLQVGGPVGYTQSASGSRPAVRYDGKGGVRLPLFVRVNEVGNGLLVLAAAVGQFVAQEHGVLLVTLIKCLNDYRCGPVIAEGSTLQRGVCTVVLQAVFALQVAEGEGVGLGFFARQYQCGSIEFQPLAVTVFQPYLFLEVGIGVHMLGYVFIGQRRRGGSSCSRGGSAVYNEEFVQSVQCLERDLLVVSLHILEMPRGEVTGVGVFVGVGCSTYAQVRPGVFLIERRLAAGGTLREPATDETVRFRVRHDEIPLTVMNNRPYQLVALQSRLHYRHARGYTVIGVPLDGDGRDSNRQGVVVDGRIVVVILGLHRHMVACGGIAANDLEIRTAAFLQTAITCSQS